MTDPLSSDSATPSKEPRPKSQLDPPSHHERSGGGGAVSSCSARKWIERSFMILVGLVAGYGVLYTQHVMDVMDANEIDHELINSAGPSPRLKAKTSHNQDRFLRKESTEMPTEVLVPVRPKIHPDERNKLLKPMVEEMEEYRKKLEAAAEEAAEANKMLKLKSIAQQLVERNDSDGDTGDDDDKDDDDNLLSKIDKTENENGGKTHPSPVAEEDRLNIVLFYADDWTMNVMGKLNPDVKTPNIDQMADRGMMFLKNCVTTSVCWVSRATLVTGTYYSRHLQALPFMEEMFNTHNWTETLFPKLKNSGYWTGLFGKWHAPQPKDKMQEAFDQRIFYYGHHWHSDFTPHGSKEMEHITETNRRHSMEFLKKRPRDKKFFLKVSFFATHAVDDTQPSYQPQNWSRYGYYPDDETHENYTTLVPPKTATERHWQELPYFFSDNNCGRLRWKQRWEPSCWQKNIRDLYALATEVDSAIGDIIDVLKEQGIYNETLLIFTTDNGDLHGEHGLAEKWYPYEESMKVPLVIQDPRMPKKLHGTTNNEWTLNVDLAPTILRAAGLEASSFMQGRDIAELYLSGDNPEDEGQPPWRNEKRAWETNVRRYDFYNATRPWRTEWFYEWNMGNVEDASGHQQNGFIDAAFALITNEWKYIFWPQKNYEQLYHRSLDPYDEYDILQNYFIHQKMVQERQWMEQTERIRMESFTIHNTTPVGDSVQSSMEVYTSMKKRFLELKKHVQSGNKI